MEARPSRWACSPYDVAVARRLADALGVAPAVGTVLARRGFREPDEARRFLAAAERHDPRSLPGVEAAAELIREHVRRGSRIAVFGDYDVDGVCSTAMLVRTLRSLGADPVWELPSRFDEGYGLSVAAVERFSARGVGLLVTVDCGVGAVDQVAAARALGLDVVVTDHHRPGSRLPDCPLVHPAPGGQPGAYPAELCAAGVVLKLSEALRGPAADEDLDLAALATVCDLVPLHDENRRIVSEGLVELSRTRKPGLRALMEVTGVVPAAVAEPSLGFRLGPRINAAGRMGRADAALELLLTEDEQRAGEVAQELDLLNNDRREAETRILFAAEAACAPQAAQAALVVAGEGWHPGVVGIVASRLVEKWRRPALVIAIDPETGSGRGSGRSVPGYDLHEGLAACAAHLTRFGGHRMAAGLELPASELDGLRRSLAAHAGAALSPDDLIPVERIDAVVPGAALGLELAEQLEALRPFGMGNPEPTLLVPAARLENVAAMGEERQHARFTLVTGASRARGVAFGSTQKALAAGEPRHVAVRLELNRWNGKVEPRVMLRALCPPAGGELRVLGEDEPFWPRVWAELERDPAGPGAAAGGGGVVIDRRGEGFAGVALDLLSSGESVLVAAAELARRRHSLATLLGGELEAGLCVVSWTALALQPELGRGFSHLVAFDPPPGGAHDPLLRSGPTASLAWGPGEVDFALRLWRMELELRPALTETYRALRAGRPGELRRALQGEGAYPRSAECCGRALRVLTELGLVELSGGGQSCSVVDGVRTDLELSPSYRAYRERFARIEQALTRELPATVRSEPVARAS